MLPNFLIIGAPRAGTTWLARNLRAHPQVFMPQTKELHFFDRHFQEGRAYYERYFEDAAGYPAVGEATPEYLYLPEMPGRIHALMPDCRLLLLLRNPVDRVYSRYWNSVAKFEENRGLSFEEKLQRKPLFLEEGMYHRHLVRYYEYFDPGAFLILDFDDIAERPQELLATTYRFLGVDAEFRAPDADARVNAAAEKPYLARSRTAFLLQKALGRLGLKRFSRVVADQNAGTLPPMSPSTRAHLVREVYAEENLRLQALTGFDVSRWQ